MDSIRPVLALALLVMLIFPGCYYDNEEELYGNNCDTSSVTYSLSIKPIIDGSCNSCHSTASAQGGIILDTYTSLKGFADSGQLSGVINQKTGFSPMPKGGSKLSDCSISTIDKWITDGSPNN
jgi:hypothetical protein